MDDDDDDGQISNTINSSELTFGSAELKIQNDPVRTEIGIACQRNLENLAITSEL